MSDRFDDERVDDDLGIIFPITEPAPVKIGEGRTHSLRSLDGNFERRVAARRPQPGAPDEFDPFILQTLFDKRLAGASLQFNESLGEILGDGLQPARFADRLHIGDADAISGQHARKRVDEDPLHPERVGNGTRMLPSCTAEAGERVAGDVVAPGNRNLADRRGHVVDGDVEEALGNFLEALVSNRIGDFLQAFLGCIPIEGLVAGRTEYRREL